MKVNDMLYDFDYVKAILVDMFPKYENPTIEMDPNSLNDIEWTLKYLAVAYELDSPRIYTNYMNWLHNLLLNIGFENSYTKELHQSILYVLGGISKKLHAFLDKCEIDYSTREKPNKLNFQAESMKYLQLILSKNKVDALEYIKTCLDNGVSVKDIYVNIIGAAMVEVGNLWYEKEISVATEHYCTMISQYIMARLYSGFDIKISKEQVILSCAIGSELHEMGIRMVSELIELEGWKSVYLGSNVPMNSLIEFAKEMKPTVIALSTTMPHHLTDLSDTIKGLREVEELKNCKIFVGGRPFINAPNLYKLVGSDYSSASAIDFINKVKEIFG